jgi:endo-1,4-beta-D-glucanase Y
MGGVQPLGDTGLNDVLRTSWNHYRDTMIAADGRPLGDPDIDDLDSDGDRRERVTFSETVAYTMLRAVLMGQDGQQPTDQDRFAFERVWTWAQANIQRSTPGFQTWSRSYWIPGTRWERQTAGSEFALDERLRDHLFAWRFVPALNGGSTPGGIISARYIEGETERNGYNAAADDFEIAVALYFASLRGWGPEGGAAYLREAQAIISDAWDQYVTEVGGQYYFFAGDQFSWSGELNPSYFRPAYFRQLFATIDPDPTHHWSLVAESSYDVISRASTMSIDDREGTAHLPPNWVRLDYRGELTESRQFPNSAGEVFGWDAFRTLYGVAQDAAWFGNSRAESYLTGTEGPLAFLSSQLHAGQLPAGFHHDGTSVRYERGVGQTGGLNTAQLFPYGGYLPFFHYAGRQAEARQMIAHLQREYNPRGYWGRDEHDYFSQNWVWFGLFLTNGHPNAAGLLRQLQALPTHYPVPVTGLPLVDVALAQIDPRLGTLTDDNRPRLDRERFNQALYEHDFPFEQLQDTVRLIGSAHYTPRISGERQRTFFQAINQIDANCDNYHLLAYLLDPREYWNNVIVLISLYAQQLTEQGTSALNDIEELIYIIQTLRSEIDCDDPLFSPYVYNQVRLDMTEAALRAQFGSRAFLADSIEHTRAFYEEGIALAVDAINLMQSIDPTEAAPDYYLISSGLLTIGDLYVKIFETTRDPRDLERAASYYQALMRSDQEVTVSAPEFGLDLAFTPADVATALEQNYAYFHHMPRADYERGRTAMDQVRGIALARNAALLIQRQEQRTTADILQELINVDLAVEQLTRTALRSDDFYLAYARAVQADLLLMLIDNIKYNLWPYFADGSSLPALHRQLVELRTILPPPRTGQVDLGYIIDQLDTLIATLEGAPTPAQRVAIAQDFIRSLATLNQEILHNAEALYRQVPIRCAYIYAWAQTKLAEIGVRRGDFIRREFRYLTPFYTDPVLTRHPIPSADFLGIAQDSLLALLHVSARDRSEAEQLLTQIISTVEHSRTLEDRYRYNFLAQAHLKQAELFSLEAQDQTVSARQRQESRRRAEELFQQVLTDLQHISEADQLIMSWRPHSILAELYTEWAILTGNTTFARRALEECYQSDSAFDYSARIESLIQRFGRDQGIDHYNQELQRRYGRRDTHGR